MGLMCILLTIPLRADQHKQQPSTKGCDSFFEPELIFNINFNIELVQGLITNMLSHCITLNITCINI